MIFRGVTVCTPLACLRSSAGPFTKIQSRTLLPQQVAGVFAASGKKHTVGGSAEASIFQLRASPRLGCHLNGNRAAGRPQWG